MFYILTGLLGIIMRFFTADIDWDLFYTKNLINFGDCHCCRQKTMATGNSGNTIRTNGYLLTICCTIFLFLVKEVV